MRSDTRSVAIGAAPEAIVAFVADPANLPRWAIGFAKGVRSQDGRWLVDTGRGEVPVSVDVDPSRGTVDFRMEPAPGEQVVAYSRVVPNGPGSEYVFTQFQHPGTPDDVFRQLGEAVGHELVTLKALLEVVCPL